MENVAKSEITEIAQAKKDLILIELSRVQGLLENLILGFSEELDKLDSEISLRILEAERNLREAIENYD